MTDLDPRLEHLLSRLRTLPEPNAQRLADLHAALRRPIHDRARGWLVLSPARAAACAALLVLATSVLWLGIWQATTRASGSRAGDTPVQFVFVSAQAAQVALVGDFNDWDPRATVLARGIGGVWSVVVPLQPGRFTYSFIVDGKVWHADPEAPLAEHDFGRPSSVVYVTPTESIP